ncbi:MAG: hypothetical protein PHT34_01570 [Oscillospiraceae bacterium]|nr:hypothetical protein [Oscillospiraceae bacterium]
MDKTKLFLTAAPGDCIAAQSFGLPVAHMAYRLGAGPHLYRSNLPAAVRGGLMVMDDLGFSGEGEVDPFCQEVVLECANRSFSGVVAAFQEHPSPVMKKIVGKLGDALHARELSFFVTELYGKDSDKAHVLIPTAISGGSLAQRLEEAISRYGAGHIALEVERVATDFFLPSPSGQGQDLTPEKLKTLREERNPSVFFSDELCAHYFTYMNKLNGAHFILFDDATSIRKKLQVAQNFGISETFLMYPEIKDMMAAIL